MLIKRVKRFKIITEWSELVNKRIQQVDCYLQEIQFDNQALILWVKGFVKRRIRYLELDGRSRKTEDRMQFAISLGNKLPEPLPLLTTELRQEYFIFQSGKVGESQALLEQEFILIVREIEVDPNLFTARALHVNSVIGHGKNSLILNIPFNFPEKYVQPKYFSGAIQFNPQSNPPVVEGEITGVVTYLSPENILREITLEQKVSLLVNDPQINSERSFKIAGEIGGVSWESDPATQEWLMKLKLDYQWFLTELKEIICKEALHPDNLQTHEIKTQFLLNDQCFDFSKTFSFQFIELPIKPEVNLDNVEYNTKLTKKGLLLTADLTFGIVFINAAGEEKYQEFRAQLEELIAIFEKGESAIQPPFFVYDLRTKILQTSIFRGELTIALNCIFQIKTYLSQIARIIKGDSANEQIIAKLLVDQESFSLLGEATFPLKCKPARGEKVKSRLCMTEPITKNGWFSVKGCLELEVSYIDTEHIFREDVFKIFFQESYIWDKLTTLDDIDLKSKVEHDSFRVDGANITYQYLISFLAEAFKEQDLRVATISSQNDSIFQSNAHLPNEPETQPPNYHLLIEGEIPLKQGKVREIVEGKALISRFKYRNSYQAILVEGNLIGELEYWDEGRYLQKETINFPFWRFIQNNLDLPPECGELTPEVTHCSYFPVNRGLWRKGSVKIRFELELHQRGLNESS